ncbi:MAG: mechanosensitive ion channel family protein [Candidatus Andersenbacteria bacterium]|nr:mechanosensitive ion channel family protein [bacterium]MDZ4225413.1 mechanosensitive ion channel family protein [Candidatus Andersenbacteria bacterium]
MLNVLFSLPVWQISWWGNSGQAYAESLIYFGLLWIIFWLLQKAILSRLGWLAQRTKTDIDDTLIAVVSHIKPPVFFLVAVYLALQRLALGDLAEKIVNGVMVVVLAYQVVMSLQILLDYVVRKKLRRSVPEGEAREGRGVKNTESALGIVNTIGRIVLWSVGSLFVLSNLGVNISSLIASLGIGGIAVALAAQNILGDLFSSLAIYFDKPFMVGDFIIVGDIKGTVKHIGIKTTRLKALSGEEVVLTNRELTSARVKNYKRMEERRVSFALGVVYETPTDKLKKVPVILKDIISGIDHLRFDRAHFKAFGDKALVFEIVYHVVDSDYELFMDAQQAMNLRIKEIFEAENIAFAYPTQTVHLERS